jgi:hypothetical protein
LHGNSYGATGPGQEIAQASEIGLSRWLPVAWRTRVDWWGPLMYNGLCAVLSVSLPLHDACKPVTAKNLPSVPALHSCRALQRELSPASPMLFIQM